MNFILAGASLLSGNRGVNALTRGTIDLLIDQYGTSITIIIFSSSTRKKVVHNYLYKEEYITITEQPIGLKADLKLFIRAFILKNKIFRSVFSNEINNIYEIIYNTEYILDLSEGDSFSDIYGIKRFLLHAALKTILIWMNKKLIFMPQTIGPFKRKAVKFYAKWLLIKSSAVFVRDNISYEFTINEMKVPAVHVIKSPDMAFYMRPQECNLPLSAAPNTLIGINISALLYNGGYTQKNMFNLQCDYRQFIESAINYFINQDNTSVLLIPHVISKDSDIENDLKICKSLSKKLSDKNPEKIFTLKKAYAEHELKYIISQCDFFVGGRMHACIGAISTHVPTAPTAYSRKFIGIWEELNMPDCIISLESLDTNEALKKLAACYSNKSNIKERLQVEIAPLKDKISNMFDAIIL